jgi:DNA-binding MarR family transcriptional regulator
MDLRDVMSQTVDVRQPSRAATLVEDPDELAALAATVETAARALLTLSARASLDLPGNASLTQLRALAAVDEAGSCTLGALADALLISVSSASRLVDRVTAAGLLDRRPSETSRRELTLQVTPRGRRLLRRHQAARRAVFADVLRDMPAHDAAALLRGLRAVQRQLDHHAD